MLRVICGLMVAATLAGCASTYKPIMPNQLVYDMREDSAMNFGYRYDVLSFRGNRKYAKRERKNFIRVVAVKMENNTQRTMKLGEDFNIYLGGNRVYPMEPEAVHKELKQGVAIYLLYSLIWLNDTECDETTGECETRMIFPVGIPIAIGNMAFAGSANKQFKAELIQYKLAGKEIQPGETSYALIGLLDTGYLPLKLVVENN